MDTSPTLRQRLQDLKGKKFTGRLDVRKNLEFRMREFRINERMSE